MIKTTHFDSFVITFGIPVFLILGLILLTQSNYFTSNLEHLSIAVTLDLVLTIPLIYFLLIRKKRISKRTVVPVFILGLLIGFTIIPKEYQSLLELAKSWVLPLVEFGIISFIAFKIYKSVNLFKKKRKESIDFFTLIKEVCSEIFGGRVAIFLATEVAVFYYGFFNWKKKKLTINEFSYHKKTGSIALFIAVIFIIFIETAVLHVLISKWNTIIAWIVSGLSIYTALQIFALLKSIPKRPILIEKDTLYLRYGIFNETAIAIDAIESLEVSAKEIESNKSIRKLSPLGNVEGHNIIINLKKENILNGFYGINKKYSSIAFYVDKKIAFKNKIDSLLNS